MSYFAKIQPTTLALAGEFVGLARDMLHGEFANHGLGV